MKEYVRRAEKADISRIAEILIFTKRLTYRPIYHNDAVSFGEMQVLPLAQELSAPGALEGWWVYDDGLVKGVLRLAGGEIQALFVDCFFQRQGVGTALLDHALQGPDAPPVVWALEKNLRAIRFYRERGFTLTGELAPVEGTQEYMVKMEGPAVREAQELLTHNLDKD